MFDQHNPAENLPTEDRRTSRIPELALELCAEIVDIAGYLSGVDREADAQMDLLGTVRARSHEVLVANQRVHGTAQAMASLSREMLGDVKETIAEARDGANRVTEVAAWVEQLDPRTEALNTRLRGMMENTQAILSIAAQVNILAINAKIEAARAGQAGRGFSVVAEAINDLSRRTAAAAQNITASTEALSTEFGLLRREAGETARKSALVRDAVSANDRALTGLVSGLTGLGEQTDDIASHCHAVEAAGEAFGPAFGAMEQSYKTVASNVRQARKRVEGLVDKSEELYRRNVFLGGSGADARFIDHVRRTAEEIGQAFENAVERGEISVEALFSRSYQPVSGSNPAQVIAPFTALTDRLLPPFQEAALSIDPRIVFCAAVDSNGYLPTHNRKFSHPQGRDPVWNAANSRNRRIFDDRVGLKAGRNTEAFLLQFYQRDMGGETQLITDVSAPIRVRGRHWGGLRLAYAH